MSSPADDPRNGAGDRPARARAVPDLPHDEVHVWHAPLDVAAEVREALVALLAPDEHTRAIRFRFAHDRDHYVVCRGLLRRLLGIYLACDPRRLTLEIGPHGKPALAPPQGGVTFNVSHSRGQAVLAFARGRRVGVDIERVREDLATDGMARTAFSVAERAEWWALAAADRVAGFFNAWSRKEAFVKATGDGIGYGLDAFDVSLAPRRQARILASRRDPADCLRWSLATLPVHAGFVGALVVEGWGWRVRSLDARAAGHA